LPSVSSRFTGFAGRACVEYDTEAIQQAPVIESSFDLSSEFICSDRELPGAFACFNQHFFDACLKEIT
jgi:hypothetical protein